MPLNFTIYLIFMHLVFLRLQHEQCTYMDWSLSNTWNKRHCQLWFFCQCTRRTNCKIWLAVRNTGNKYGLVCLVWHSYNMAEQRKTLRLDNRRQAELLMLRSSKSKSNWTSNRIEIVLFVHPVKRFVHWSIGSLIDAVALQRFNRQTAARAIVGN